MALAHRSSVLRSRWCVAGSCWGMHSAYMRYRCAKCCLSAGNMRAGAALRRYCPGDTAHNLSLLPLVHCSAAFKPAQANAPRRLSAVRPQVRGAEGCLLDSVGQVLVAVAGCSVPRHLGHCCSTAAWKLHTRLYECDYCACTRSLPCTSLSADPAARPVPAPTLVDLTRTHTLLVLAVISRPLQTTSLRTTSPPQPSSSLARAHSLWAWPRCVCARGCLAARLGSHLLLCFGQQSHST